MKNYGYDAEAKELVEKMFQNAEGLLGDGPIRENYNPLTGRGPSYQELQLVRGMLLPDV